ncbi:MAG: bacteriohemerythrin [Planctomycetes bacterium]|nr:bacteriohemerythrin [Planctomycetota bacterium]
MALMTWTDKYATGIASIDNQHKKLIELLNQLQDAMLAGSGNDAIAKILDGLVQYTVTHFAHEEKLFAAHGYIEAANHKAEHEKLAKKVAEFQREFKAGKTKLSVTVMNFLRDWLNSHILVTDMKYAPFLKAKGVS